MEKKTKIFIGIGLGLVAAAGVFIAITKPFKKKEDEAPAEEKSTDTGSGSGSGASSPAPKKTSLVLQKAAQKLGGGFNTGTTGKPAAPSTSSTPAKTTGGKKVWVYASTNGVKVYKKSTKKGVTLGSLYNTYGKGKIIGNFVGSTSVGGEKYTLVMDGKTPLVVIEKLTYTNTF